VLWRVGSNEKAIRCEENLIEELSEVTRSLFGSVPLKAAEGRERRNAREVWEPTKARRVGEGNLRSEAKTVRTDVSLTKWEKRKGKETLSVEMLRLQKLLGALCGSERGSVEVQRVRGWLKERSVERGEQRAVKDSERNVMGVTHVDVLRAKRSLKGMIVSALDKSSGELYCECPIVHYERMVENVRDYKEVYEVQRNLTPQLILKFMKEEWRAKGLYKIASWTAGNIPRARADPKSKDPIKKTRLISSYRKSPLRRLWRLAGKGLTFVFQNLRKKVRHFTLHRLDAMKRKVGKGLKRISKVYGNETEILTAQFDVKRMFTDLDRGEIMKALSWLFGEVGKMKKDQGRELRTNRRYVTVRREEPHLVRWGRAANDEATACFSLEELKLCVEMDLKWCYLSVGEVVMKQGNGAPIGGMMSRFYGDLVCSYHEWQMIKRMGKGSRRVYGIRQVDDLIMMQAVRRGDAQSQAEGERLWKEVRGDEGERKVYKGGLEIEEEEVVDNEKQRVHEFAGTILSIRKDGKSFEARTRNKNWKSLMENGRQEKHRYPSKGSYVSTMIKEGVMVGSLARIPTQCYPEKLAVTCLLQDAVEWVSVGYELADYRRCVRRMGMNWLERDNREALICGLNRLEVVRKQGRVEGSRSKFENSRLQTCPLEQSIKAMSSVCELPVYLNL
jgi:ribosomal protein L19